MPTFDEYLSKLKSGQSSTTTFEWYLNQIRQLAADVASKKETEIVKPLSGKKIITAMEQANISRPDAREEVKKSFTSQTTNAFNNNMIGKMLFFQYDPKTKDKLPYWDMFPVAFLINNRKAGSALAFNMHYLPPYERARLMFQLYSVINTTELDDDSRLLITYKLLNENAKFVYFKPCIKRYLYSHIRSRISIIKPQEWNKVMMLPLAKFMKASEWKVWEDSIKKIRHSRFQVNQ